MVCIHYWQAFLEYFSTLVLIAKISYDTLLLLKGKGKKLKQNCSLISILEVLWDIFFRVVF